MIDVAGASGAAGFAGAASRVADAAGADAEIVIAARRAGAADGAQNQSGKKISQACAHWLPPGAWCRVEARRLKKSCTVEANATVAMAVGDRGGGGGDGGDD